MSLEFALDLVQQGILRPDQLIRLIDATGGHEPPLATLAIQNNLLTVHQVNEILDLQSATRKSFRAWAVAMGWLSEEAMNELLDRQALTRPTICSAIIALGILSTHEVDQLYRAFQNRTRTPTATMQPPPPKFGMHRAPSGPANMTVARMAKMAPRADELA
jgi:hypothetical protein